MLYRSTPNAKLTVHYEVGFGKFDQDIILSKISEKNKQSLKTLTKFIFSIFFFFHHHKRKEKEKENKMESSLKLRIIEKEAVTLVYSTAPFVFLFWPLDIECRTQKR